MKLKFKFVIREVAGNSVAVAVGRDNAYFNGMVKLNSSGELIFKMLNEGNVTKDDMISALIEKYDISKEQAENTVKSFTDNLRQNGLLEE